MATVGQSDGGDDGFWRRAFFSEGGAVFSPPDASKKKPAPDTAKVGGTGELWLTRLFQGDQFYGNPDDKMAILKNGVEVHEIAVDKLGQETVIGRHPTAQLQLEAYKLGLFHAVIRKKDAKLYIEGLDLENGTLLNRKKLKPKVPVRLRDGDLVDLPGYQLRFALADAPPQEGHEDIEADELEEIPSYFYTPPSPPACPLLSNLVAQRSQIGMWSEGVTTLRVADIIEETHDVKTFRLVGEKPLLFSYKPGQFVTFLLNIDGREVQRSYSMSSSPSRPHVLELTIKRVPGGLVSNWFCDHVKLAQVLTIRGPAGKFSCFNYPSAKMVFIGAGSGITPIMSMSRWIVDTTSDVDVKMLVSFKSPADIIFRKELELISARHSRLQVGVTVTSGWHGTESWTGFTGRISPQMINIFVPDLAERHVFMCGPEPFAQAVTDTLREIGFDLSKLHTESFGTGRVAQGARVDVPALKLSEPLHKVTFAKSGLTVDTDEKLTLLELAEAHGIEIDYACRIGSCGACEVKCRGTVTMSKDCEIDQRTRDAGFVYACCSAARTDLEIEA
jgi:glycine betaine catabolism B